MIEDNENKDMSDKEALLKQSAITSETYIKSLKIITNVAFAGIGVAGLAIALVIVCVIAG